MSMYSHVGTHMAPSPALFWPPWNCQFLLVFVVSVVMNAQGYPNLAQGQQDT